MFISPKSSNRSREAKEDALDHHGQSNGTIVQLKDVYICLATHTTQKSRYELLLHVLSGT